MKTGEFDRVPPALVILARTLLDGTVEELLISDDTTSGCLISTGH